MKAHPSFPRFAVWGDLIVLSAVFLFLVYIRLMPAIGSSIEFQYDSAFNYRLTMDVIRTGRIPETDALSMHPEGRSIGSYFLPGMYYTCTLFHKFVNRLCDSAPYQSIILFCSFSGALIVLPIFLICMELYRRRFLSYVAAITAGITPAYLGRTFCDHYRPEVLALPLLLMSLYFFTRSLGHSARKRRMIYALLSSLFLVASSCVWRISIIFLIGYIIAFFYVLIKEKGSFIGEYALSLLVVLAAILPLYVLSPGTLLRITVQAHSMIGPAFLNIARYRLGLENTLGEYAAVLNSVCEFQPIAPGIEGVISAPFLSFAILFIPVAILIHLTRRPGDVQKDIVFAFIIVFTLLSLLVIRSRILIGSLVVVTMCECVAYALQKGRIRKVILLNLVAIILFATAFHAHETVMRARSLAQIHHLRKTALIAILEKTPNDAVIQSFWSEGFDIQTYTGRATLVDGRLEDPKNIKRIIQAAKHYLSNEESGLLDFLKQRGATHVLLPLRSFRRYASYAGVDVRSYIEDGQPTDKSKKTLHYRMVMMPQELKGFKRLFSNEAYALYEVST